MATVVKMPQLAAGEETATVQSWLVTAGDEISEGQPIVEIETEKATGDFAADVGGVFAGAVVDAGATVDVGTVIAVIAAAGEDPETALAEHAGNGAGGDAGPDDSEDAVEADADAGSSEADSRAAGAGSSDRGASSTETSSDTGDHVRRFASPLARRLAKEHGIPLDQLEGTGPGGRVVRRDVEAYLESSPAEVEPSTAEPAKPSAIPATPDAEFEDVPHTGMRRAIARRLTESKSTVPHFYLTADVRVDELLSLRKQINESGDVKISVNDFVIKAVAKALQDVPEANAIWTDEATRRFSGVDISVAVSVPGGLLTPVMRGVEHLSLTQISGQMKDYAQRARDGELKQDELVGGSFSISNLGMYGTQEFSAILNPPQAGILAVGAASKRPVVDDEGELEVATVMTVTLSADHRVLDGALAAEWLAAFAKRIEHPLGMLV
ncbi:MAG TPA: pyruvate dehydrogenase complex dihydrolipoamide acetyltransferase [Candidatus Agrococcus pullicola]|uniref:Acetyltransferase component of pyruvate dehydrogenase complex n=1 Tax=Candidatus Agrococcus pullicola TaxID=2838429 RepID=A0A9D1YWA4_9MICO|nr:pyruvate dehydrogenase complex dihydrolipoamide acetyltransferase [Candidatus Agrococcus pullicola]